MSILDDQNYITSHPEDLLPFEQQIQLAREHRSTIYEIAAKIKRKYNIRILFGGSSHRQYEIKVQSDYPTNFHTTMIISVNTTTTIDDIVANIDYQLDTIMRYRDCFRTDLKLFF